MRRIAALAVSATLFYAGTAGAEQFDFIAATTNKYNTHILIGAGGRVTAWQDCDIAAYNCPSKSTGTYERVGSCVHFHIDWNMRTHNYPANGARDSKTGQPC